MSRTIYRDVDHPRARTGEFVEKVNSARSATTVPISFRGEGSAARPASVIRFARSSTREILLDGETRA